VITGLRVEAIASQIEAEIVTAALNLLYRPVVVLKAKTAESTDKGNVAQQCLLYFFVKLIFILKFREERCSY
jgi:hypothetical protein